LGSSLASQAFTSLDSLDFDSIHSFGNDFFNFVSMYTLNLLLAAALAAPLSAKPILQKRSFVHHVRRSHDHTHPAAGSNAVYHAFRKHGFDMTGMKQVSTGAPVVRAAQQAGTGSVTNQPANGAAEYVSPVSVGGQTLVLDFDTGSSDL
jgi:hypothetical protein